MKGSVLHWLLAGLGALAAGCSSSEKEPDVACSLDPSTNACVCEEDHDGGLSSCKPEDVDGACFGNATYCICRPWRCASASAGSCSCEFGGAHFSSSCTGTNCCFAPDLNGGVCSCVEDDTPCLDQVVSDCSLETLRAHLPNTDGKFPRVEKCPP